MFNQFVKLFFKVNWKLKSLYLAFLMIFISAAFAFHLLEDMPFWDALYLTFITGLTVGYGDLSPITGFGRVIAIFIALCGLVLTGVMVATAVQVVKILFEDQVPSLKNDTDLR